MARRLWMLDASDPGTVVLEGRKVKEWRDRSGNGHHAVQHDPAKRPSYLIGSLNDLAVMLSEPRD